MTQWVNKFVIIVGQTWFVSGIIERYDKLYHVSKSSSKGMLTEMRILQVKWENSFGSEVITGQGGVLHPLRTIVTGIIFGLHISHKDHLERFVAF